jgi:polyphosphate glucokinase
VGKAGLRWLGKKKWRRAVVDVLKRLKTALEVNDVVVGGGNAKLLGTLPSGIRVGRNANAFVGGYRLWKTKARHKAVHRLD